MVLVTTEHSMFNIKKLLSSEPFKEVTVYRYNGGEFHDFDGNPPPQATLNAIMRRLTELDVPLNK